MSGLPRPPGRLLVLGMVLTLLAGACGGSRSAGDATVEVAGSRPAAAGGTAGEAGVVCDLDPTRLAEPPPATWVDRIPDAPVPVCVGTVGADRYWLRVGGSPPDVEARLQYRDVQLSSIHDDATSWPGRLEEGFLVWEVSSLDGRQFLLGEVPSSVGSVVVHLDDGRRVRVPASPDTGLPVRHVVFGMSVTSRVIRVEAPGVFSFEVPEVETFAGLELTVDPALVVPAGGAGG
ncbi:MAG: hypothetical protein M5U14_03555 [Acidimicrobiia bacterium]|nr:hypothetical protein [Acidimicrobiia bacterium]